MGTQRIAFIQSCWHRDIVDKGRDAFAACMAERGHPKSRLDFIEVPGAFELPLRAKLLAESGDYVAIVCAGLVVDGGIYRHDFVAQSVISGPMQVQLETRVPVLSMVLTPHHFQPHDEHRAFFSEHFATGAGSGARDIDRHQVTCRGPRAA
jgi:6,7-dimethyl-8-ribityllumazine synthase